MSFTRAGLAVPPALKTIVWASALALGAGAAQAQSLTETVEAARGYDATYLSARSNADAAEYRYQQARGLHLPSAGLTVEGLRGVSNTPYTQPTSSSQNQGNLTLNAQQTIFNRQNDLQIDEAEKLVEVARLQLVAAEQDLMVRVASAYFQVLASTDALQTVQANRAAIGEQLASAKRNFEVGNATITDTREAEARADLAVSQEVSATNDLQVAQVTLDQLIGRNGVKPHPLALPATLPPILPSQAQDWVNLAQAENPVLKQARLNFDVAKLETSRAKAGHLPVITAGASVGKNYNHAEASYAANLVPPGTSTSYGGWGSSNGVNVTLTVPLFSGFQIENRVKETVALEETARTQQEGAVNTATLLTRQTFLSSQALAAQVKALEAAETSSKLQLDATQLGYKVGVKVNLDVLNAQFQLYTTQRDLATARYAYLVGSLKLRQAAGTLTQNDIVATNALLVP
jgi:outer membrane protein